MSSSFGWRRETPLFRAGRMSLNKSFRGASDFDSERKISDLSKNSKGLKLVPKPSL